MTNLTSEQNLTLGSYSSDFIHLRVISWYIYAVIASINSVLHGIGGILLIKTYKRRKTSQHLLLVNLSLTELLRNITRVATCSIFITERRDSVATYTLWTVYITFVTYLYFSAMFLITVDRLVATLLNVRHKMICTSNRTQWLVAVVWLLVSLVTVCVSVYYHSLYGILWMYVCDVIHRVLVYRVIMVLTVLYLISAVVCYSLIFLRYTRSKRSIAQNHLSSLQLFRKSKFYVSILLITSFIFLQVVPYGILTIKGDKLSLPVKMVLNISSEVSDTVDFLIYVFMYNAVYNLAKRYREMLCYFISTGKRMRRGSNLSRLIEGELTSLTSSIRYKRTQEYISAVTM